MFDLATRCDREAQAWIIGGARDNHRMMASALLVYTWTFRVLAAQFLVIVNLYDIEHQVGFHEGKRDADIVEWDVEKRRPKVVSTKKQNLVEAAKCFASQAPPFREMLKTYVKHGTIANENDLKTAAANMRNGLEVLLQPPANNSDQILPVSSDSATYADGWAEVLGMKQPDGHGGPPSSTNTASTEQEAHDSRKKSLWNVSYEDGTIIQQESFNLLMQSAMGYFPRFYESHWDKKTVDTIVPGRRKFRSGFGLFVLRSRLLNFFSMIRLATTWTHAKF